MIDMENFGQVKRRAYEIDSTLASHAPNKILKEPSTKKRDTQEL